LWCCKRASNTLGANSGFYDLFSYIDLGVIFNGTIGLEMMLSDIPVVSTGKTTYQGLGFSMEPETVEQYHAILLGNQQPPSVDKEQLELFAYFYFIKTLIPWTLTTSKCTMTTLMDSPLIH